MEDLPGRGWKQSSVHEYYKEDAEFPGFRWLVVGIEGATWNWYRARFHDSPGGPVEDIRVTPVLYGPFMHWRDAAYDCDRHVQRGRGQQ